MLEDTKVYEIMKYPITKKNVFHPSQIGETSYLNAQDSYSGSSLFSVFEKLYLLGNHRIPIIDKTFELVDRERYVEIHLTDRKGWSLSRKQLIFSIKISPKFTN